MKVALYYPWIYLKSGAERLIYQYAEQSRHTITIFTHHYDKQATFPQFENLTVIELPPVSIKRDIVSVLSAAFTIAAQKIDLTEFDVFFTHSDGLGDLIMLRNSDLPTLCYCHTPLRPVFDKVYAKIAFSKLSWYQRPLFLLFKWLFGLLDRSLWRRYSQILFNSNETLKRALEGKLITSDSTKYIVLHPGIDQKKIWPTWKYLPYFLLPGRIMWTKNIELAIEAFIRLQKVSKKARSFFLVIAGQVDEKSQVYLSKLKKIASKSSAIKFLLNPSDEQLAKYYQYSWASLICSYNEDWGLTTIEANANGKPVVGVNRGGPAEAIKNGKTGLLVEPEPNDLGRALQYLITHPLNTKKMGKMGYYHSKHYNIINFVNSIDTHLEKLVIE